MKPLRNNFSKLRVVIRLILMVDYPGSPPNGGLLIFINDSVSLIYRFIYLLRH